MKKHTRASCNWVAPVWVIYAGYIANFLPVHERLKRANILHICFGFFQGCGTGSGRVHKFSRGKIWIRVFLDGRIQLGPCVFQGSDPDLDFLDGRIRISIRSCPCVFRWSDPDLVYLKVGSRSGPEFFLAVRSGSVFF